MNTDMLVSLALVRPMVMPETLTCQCSWYTVSIHGTRSVFMVYMVSVHGPHGQCS